MSLDRRLGHGMRIGCLALRLAGVVVTASACQSTGAMHLRAAFDATVRFEDFTTFAQADPPAAAEGLPGYSEIEGRRIQRVIAARLEAQGLARTAWDDADLQVAFSLDGKPRTEIWVWHSYSVAGPHTTGATRYLKGTLIVDMIDRERSRLAWHGRAQQETMAESFSPDTVLLAVERLLTRFPPEAPRDTVLRSVP